MAEALVIPQNVRDTMPLAARMVEIPAGKRLYARWPHAEVVVAPVGGGRLAVRVIWHREEAYSDHGDGDGTGYIRVVDEIVYDGWCNALFGDLSAAIRAAASMDPGAWLRKRRN